ncbi:aminotransferase class V-fold PLP-dependent enzyme [Kibdelosporangium philippinense]|uniref:Aminotransferase class V-fold PLP-dependent enzyme n=1 Tax=Kibdelosporangium philippinense TaxID=211113 RepID=A0ABS8Z1V5_9PSEU|nr:aminotransferase class V-fold PLP-dependent enzyme [Kibdelosporangium philippinense]MCE7001342.1 aminotransferase class V-fold PLP-dependent enzyme [Kibdelosporangium philippinense]
MSFASGRHFLQIPGPTNVPDQVLRAMSAPTIDHRGPQFAAMVPPLLEALKPVFGTTGDVVLYPSSGTGAWEAALVNTLSPGDRVLCFETGHFATLWQAMARDLGLEVDFVPGDWRHPVDPAEVSARLTPETKAVLVVHNETSTGVTSDIAAVRRAMGDHPALLMVDTVSSLGSIDYRHDEWGVDVTVSCSQKGLMLPPGLGLTAVSAKALAASGGSRRSYWAWQPIIEANKRGAFPYTPPTNLLYGLREALHMLHSEGLPEVYARHARHAAATRAAVQGWGLELLCLDPSAYSNTLTAILVPGADHVREVILDRFDMSLGAGLGKVAGEVFRIGHLGHFNDLSLAGTLSGVQMGLQIAGVPVKDGVSAALSLLAEA